jgi:hypothetical protein
VSDFAIVDDVAIRWRPLSSTEVATVSALICDASSMIRNRWSDIDDRIAAGTLPAQEATRVVANMVRRAMLNRPGAAHHGRQRQPDPGLGARNVEVVRGVGSTGQLADEQTVNQERIVSRWRIFTEPAADILPTDRVTWQGKTFQVDGEIQGWDIGNGVHHHEGYLRLVTG